MTEDGEFVRRRGRWINHRVMEIYIQEVSSVLYLSTVPTAVGQKVLDVARAFPAMLEQTISLSNTGFPEKTWFLITAAGRDLSPRPTGFDG